MTAKALEVAQPGGEDAAGAAAALVTLFMDLRSSEIVSRVVRDLGDRGTLLWIPESKTPAGKRTIEVPELLQPILGKLVDPPPSVT